jgi:ribosomal protein S18 acetylase RimI-like enzyme
VLIEQVREQVIFMATIRQAAVGDAAQIARVHVESWQTTYRGIMPDSFLDQLSYERRAEYWVETLSNATGSQFMYVAEVDSGTPYAKIVGFAMGGPERTGDPDYQGEIYAIYLLKAYQRQGLGLGLIQAIVERLYHTDMHSMLIWVLAQNAARHFYEALGGQAVRTQIVTIAGINFDEIAYGWTDITALRPLVSATS